MSLAHRLHRQLLALRWRAKVRHWRRTRLPRTWRDEMQLYVIRLQINTWKYLWLWPLLTLEYLGLISREQLKDATKNPFKDE